MIGFQCRRTAASALRQSSAAARIRLVNGAPSPMQTRAFLLASIPRESRSPRISRISRYSTASNPPEPAQSDVALPEKPDYLNAAESAIWDKLAAEFEPTELIVQDISGGCGSMYGIEIASEKFRGANMLKQQRMVNAVLGDEMKNWHGVQLRTRTPR
ncbi:bola-like protein [Xylaria palmicola]|nr:bola-like protein [Xylaria palmicola]